MQKSRKEITVQIYFDFSCPYCHSARKNLNKALIQYAAKKPSAKINVYFYSYILHASGPRSTVLAHCLLEHATQEGKGSEMCDEIFDASYERHENISDKAVLTKLAEKLDVKGNWDTKEWKDEVLECNRKSKEVALVKVIPYFVVEGETALQGTNDPKTFIEIFDKYFN